MTRKSVIVSRIAIMLAISMVTNFISFQTHIGRAGFVYFSAMLAGIVFGPLVGSLIAGAGDMILAFVAPQGAYLPLITISNMLMATIAGIIYHKFKFKLIYKIILSSILVYLICSLVVTPLGMTPFYASIGRLGNDFWKFYSTLLIKRSWQQALWIVINSSILYLFLLKVTKHLKIEEYYIIKGKKKETVEDDEQKA